FPVLTDASAFVGFLVAMLGMEGVVDSGSSLFDSLNQINPEQWQTRNKFEVGADANLGGTAGVKMVKGGSEKDAKWDQTEGRGDMGSPTLIQRMLNLNVGADIYSLLGAGVGYEVSNVNRE